MRAMISVVLILILWGAVPVLAQLPPEMLADSYLLRVEQAISDGDHARARAEIDKIMLLEEEHDLNLSEEFHFRYAKAAATADLPEQALEAVEKYLLAAGREGRHYVAALGLMNKAQDAIEGRKEPQVASNEPSPPAEAAAQGPVEPEAGVAGPSGVQERNQTPPSAAGMTEAQVVPDCGKWNTVEYFKAATVESVAACLAAGADPMVESKNKWKWTPLHLAARYNENPAVIEALLKAGADLAALEKEGRTPLHLAAIGNENPAVIDALIRAGADLRARDKFKDTPLHDAVRVNGDPDIIKALLNADADARDVLKWSPLHEAAVFNEDPVVIRDLIKAGADPLARDTWKETPLHYAVRYNENPASVGALIKAGAKLNVKSVDRLTPLHYAARSNENPVFVRTLIEAGAKLDVEGGKNNWTPLHFAARNNKNPEMLRTLIEAGAYLNWRSYYGTPLHLAAANAKDPTFVKILIEAGADLEAKAPWNGKVRPLHDAARYNQNPAVIKVLIKAGANLEARDGDQETPLHHAARYNQNPEIIKALLKAGSDLTALNEKGRTPLYMAEEHNENPDVRQVLLAAGAGRVERQVAAAQARRKAEAGPGFLEAAIGIAGGTAIAAAGGGTDEALEAGALFAEGVIGGTSPRGSTVGVPVTASTGNVGSGTGGGSCEVPGYPRPANPQGLGLSWCPASVDFQVRVFALTAAGAKCAITLGNSSTPDQVRARRSEIEGYCERLAALDGRLVGNGQCLCPEGYPDRTDFVAAPAVYGVKDSVEEARRQREEARRQREEEAERQIQAAQAAERERLRIEGRNRSVLDSDCTCISIDERSGEYSCSDGFVSAPDSKKPLCDIRRR